MIHILLLLSKSKNFFLIFFIIINDSIVIFVSILSAHGQSLICCFFEDAINPIAVMGNPQHLHTPPNCTTHLWKPVAQCHAAAVQNRLDFCSPQAQLQWWSSTNRAQIYLFRFPVKAFCDVLLGTPSSQVCVQA